MAPEKTGWTSRLPKPGCGTPPAPFAARSTPPKFKDYILLLIFVKRLSDVFDDELARLAEAFGDEKTARMLVKCQLVARQNRHAERSEASLSNGETLRFPVKRGETALRVTQP